MVRRLSSSSTLFKQLRNYSVSTEAKFHLEPLHDRETKVYIAGPGHMTKMVTISIYIVKSLKNLLQNHWVDCLETLYVASETMVLESLYKQ